MEQEFLGTLDSDSFELTGEQRNQFSHGDEFFNTVINLIKEMKFPAFKKDIINQAKRVASAGADPDTVTLLQSLDGYIQYRDIQEIF